MKEFEIDMSPRAIAERELENEVKKDKELRVDLDKQLQKLKQLNKNWGSTERGTAIIRLKEAIMWLGMDLKRLNEPNPYPNSYNPDNAKVDPTADDLKL